MSATVIIGSQWGDEGKGKIVDLLSENVDVVVRYQGGANAGHTIFVNNKKFVLHLIPSGIIRDDILCVIGNGVVLDPSAFFEELEILINNNIEISDRIKILPNTHIVLPYHKILDQLNESRANKIGTTGRGIGPAYVDKYSRIGIRAIDLFDLSYAFSLLEKNLEIKNLLFQHYYDAEKLIFEKLRNYLSEISQKLTPFIVKDSTLVSKLINNGKKVLLEGAQGSLLDVDHGTYPFVTSSNPSIGGALTGSGINPKQIKEIYGVTKAYCTRVGEGPFPTELKNEIGDVIRQSGNEYGATTGRPRRCGWLDLPALKFSSRINGFDYLAITKLDVLSELDEIKICTSYKLDGELIDYFPVDSITLSKVEPVYKTFEGWKKSILGLKKFEDLPDKAKEYLSFIEENIEVKIKIISTGFERNDSIIL
jgi:adenylosuccinate synthase